MMNVTEELERLRIVPVVVIRDPLRATLMARALVDGGLPCAEITFRTPGAPEALRRIAADNPNMLVGAGTVLNPGQAAQARDAGARFIVSPGFNPRVVDYCQEHDIPVYPGVCTPSEIQSALEKGLEVLKFFPAEPMGGPRFLKAISAPFPGLRFIPTGGIGVEHLPGYLELGEVVVACGGSWIAPAGWINAGSFDRIRAEAERAVAVARGERPENQAPGAATTPAMWNK
ncbi:MAG: bifunctional 4-hydroxy-2-oxoglutarate aldolase/2-dehydro-3-deoxy-phosphogluconate aldolase [Gemmatimonas sp.]|nr:bifunctional 4-hydroxy-2-oxoglutarate aldolase/2-dehydro-3-deoxy-phosphogluconate aldolase [Gemmatimonas sp.]